MTTMKVRICSQCKEAMREESDGMLKGSEIAGMCYNMGGDIADHFCNSTDSGSRCDCGCRRHRR